jgi:hypothetical protein
MRAVISLVLGVMLVTPGSAAEKQVAHANAIEREQDQGRDAKRNREKSQAGSPRSRTKERHAVLLLQGKVIVR